MALDFGLMNRVLTILTAYAVAFGTLIVHAIYVGPVHGYLGVPYVPIDRVQYIAVFLAVTLSAFCVPAIMSRFSDVAIAIFYYFAFLPMVPLICSVGILKFDTQMAVMTSTTVGMIAITLFSRRADMHDRQRRVSRPLFWLIALSIFALCAVVIVAVNYQSMRFVGFDDVYVQRFAARVGVGSSGYAFGMMSGSVNPFLIAYGLVHRRVGFFLLGVAGQVLVYSVLAQKIILLNIFVTLGFYALLKFRSGNLDTWGGAPLWRVGVVTTMFIGIGLLFVAIPGSDTPGSLMDQYNNIVLMRTFGLPAGLMVQWAEFFRTHALTYFTHVGPLRAIFGSPYGNDPSLVIGKFIATDGRAMNANGGFFASDGFAALGLIAGPPIVGALCGLVLRLFDWASTPRDRMTCALAATGIGFGLTAGSMFTTLWSGGGFLLVLVLYLYSLSTPHVRTEPRSTAA